MITRLEKYISEPPVSRQQQKYIYALRGKYKNKENTPEKYKWIWNKDWELPVKK